MSGRTIANAAGREVRVLPDTDAIAREAAERFAAAATEAITARGRFTVALAGGSTPERLYRLLAAEPFRGRVAWGSVHVFFGDERTVPPDDPQSNYRMAKGAMLDALPIPPAQVHRMEGERDPLEAATAYERAIRETFALEAGQMPRFDLVLLGMGPDGHTASLFPHTAALDNYADVVTPNYVAKLETWRLTLTYPALNAAARVLFLAGGADKADALREVLQGEANAAEYPSQGVLPTHGTVTFLLDEAISARLAP